MFKVYEFRVYELKVYEFMRLSSMTNDSRQHTFNS